jgi:hypothetical protein
MEPLDLSTDRPRGPRVQLAGMTYTARVIDKLRAALPGGNPNGFLPFTGLSEAWQKYSGIDLHELYNVVRSAASEQEVVQWIDSRTRSIDKPAFNAKLEGFVTTRLPESWRAAFESFYPAELRAAHVNMFDLLEADDERLYGTSRYTAMTVNERLFDARLLSAFDDAVDRGDAAQALIILREVGLAAQATKILRAKINDSP